MQKAKGGASLRPGLAILASGVIVVGVLYIVVMRLMGLMPKMRTRTKELFNMATSYTVGALLWPLLWYLLVGPVMITTAPLTFAGFVWPVVILFLDLMWVTKQPFEPEDTKKTSFTFDGNAISSLSFALGGILLSQIGKTFAASASPMLSACIFLVIAFVIPTPGVHARTGVGAVILAVRKIAMAFCVGLLISSIAISLQVGINRRQVVTREKLLVDTPRDTAHPHDATTKWSASKTG